MRFFLGKDAGAVIRDKSAFDGDTSKTDSIVAAYLAARPGYTAPEVDQVTFDAAVVVPDPTAPRASAISNFLNDPSATSKLERAILLVILDEINVIRGLLSPVQPARTVAQLKTAVQNKLNSGAAD